MDPPVNKSTNSCAIPVLNDEITVLREHPPCMADQALLRLPILFGRQVHMDYVDL